MYDTAKSYMGTAQGMAPGSLAAKYGGATDHYEGDAAISQIPTAFHIAEATMDDARQLAYRIENLVDRLCGGIVTNEGKAALGAPTPAAVFPNLRDSASNTSIAIRAAMSAMDRLERELP